MIYLWQNMLRLIVYCQNKKGREVATNLPPQPCSLIRYQRGDVLIANIRPYLKKVWFADIDGGASPDVLVFRAKDGHSPSFLLCYTSSRFLF